MHILNSQNSSPQDSVLHPTCLKFTKKSTDESNLNKSQVASKRSSESEYMHKHVLFWFHFYVWSGTVYVSLYKHTWLWLSADLKQTLCWWHTHTHRHTQWPTFLSWTGPTKNRSPCIHLWFRRGYKGWIHTQRQTQIYTPVEQGQRP